MKEYPKVLIINSEDVFKCNTSSAFTVRSFFEGWPADNLRQIVCGEGVSDNTTLVLTNKQRLLCHWFSRKKRQPVSIQRNETQYYKRHFSLKQVVRQFLVNIYVLLPYLYSRQVSRFIDDFSPDIIYSSCQNVTIVRFINRISRRKRIPYIPHFFDDESSILFKDFPILRRYALRTIEVAIKRAPVVLCICELMCKEYEKRYGYLKFLPLMHSVYPINNDLTEVSGKKKLLYAGSLYLGRYKTLIELSNLIAKFGDSSIDIYIYTNKPAWEELHGYFEDYPFVHYGGFISQEELTKEICKAYGLLFVESFDEEMLVYTRLSMSTKIPEYLSSGQPILAIGNETQGSIAYLKEHNAAYIIANSDDMDTVVPLFLERQGWDVISNNAQVLFERNHSREIQKERFCQIVVNSIG